MKAFINIKIGFRPAILLAFSSLMLLNAYAQDAATPAAKSAGLKPVKNTFQSVWIIDNQTVMVPIKGTFELDIMHRFGTVNNGYNDFWGFFAPSNIRLGVNYAPIKKLFVGIGITKSNMLWDGNIKYSIFTQSQKRGYPVSLTYYGNMAYDTRKDPDGGLFKYETNRYSFFHQLIIARKITDKFSIQVAPSLSHQNFVYGFYKQVDSATRVIANAMEHNHLAISIAARYKLTQVTSLLFNYDQPLTKHYSNNPNPNVSFGLEFNTSSHSFQLFAGNYYFLNPQRNNLFNRNSPFNYTDGAGNAVKGGKFLIGFNITRLWNY